MKLYAKMIIAMVGLFTGIALTACSTITCRLKDRAVGQLAAATAEFLECDNKASIIADFDKAAQALGICKAKQTGPIADAVCKPIVDTVVNDFVGNVPPKAWACKATKAKEQLSSFLVEQCKRLPVEE